MSWLWQKASVKLRKKKVRSVLVSSLLFLLLLPTALAQPCSRGSWTFANWQVQQGPIIITSPGNYCLEDNIYVDYSWVDRYGNNVIIIGTRDVVINLNDNSIVNRAGSSWLQARWAPAFTAIELSYNSPIIGDVEVTNGNIVGFDRGIFEVAPLGRGKTDQIIVKEINFIDNSNSIYTAPGTAIINQNNFDNNQVNALIVYGLTVQYADAVEVSNNNFMNLIRPINIDYSQKAVLQENYLENSQLNQRMHSKGISLSAVPEALVEGNKLLHFNYGIEASFNSKAQVTGNKGCDITTPTLAFWNSFIQEWNNYWGLSC